jgi:zona occludens toxin
VAIFAYTGLPRSGKTYNAVANVIVSALREGRRVCTNVPLYEEKIRETVKTGELVAFPVAEVQQTPEAIRKYVTPGTVFVLDEVWRLWPAGEKANKTPEAFKSLLAEHGHMVDDKGNACSITLIVQDLGNIGMFARRLVEQTFIHTKLTHVGMSQRFRVDIFHGPVTGAVGPQSNRLREIFGTYEEKIYALYKSHTMSEKQGDGANEKHTDRRGNVLLRPAVILGAVAVPLLIASGIYGLAHFSKSKPAAASTVGGATQLVSSQSAPSPISSGPFQGFGHSSQETHGDAPTWRVTGFVQVPSAPEKSVAFLTSNAGKVVTVGYDRCKKISGQPLQCYLEGFFYSETGAKEQVTAAFRAAAARVTD